MSKALSFAWNHEGLGHVSRLVAIHHELRALGWKSLFLVEEHQEMLAEYGFAQVVIPRVPSVLLGDQWWSSDVADSDLDRLNLAQRLIAWAFDDFKPQLVLHDVVVHSIVHEYAMARQVEQHLVLRARRDVLDPSAWLRANGMQVRVVYQPEGSVTEVVDGVHFMATTPVVRPRLSNDSPWEANSMDWRCLITAGGGGHVGTGEFLSQALAGCALYLETHELMGQVLVIPGPFASERFTIPASSRMKVQVVPYLPATVDLFAHAERVICQGGYNTLNEALQHGVRPVVVAEPRALDDQSARTRLLGDQVITVRPQASAIEDALDRLASEVRWTVSQAAASDGAQQIAHFADGSYRGLTVEPEAYRTGETTFDGLRLVVNSDVLVPRDKTVLLVEHAERACRELLTSGSRLQVLDVGTGSGACLLALLRRLDDLADKVEAAGTDISGAALLVARENGIRWQPGRVIDWMECDLLPDQTDKPFDIVIANLPYLPVSTVLPLTTRAEPAVAVTDASGDLAHRLIRLLAAWRRPPTRMLMEFDPLRIDELAEYATTQLACEARVWRDAGGRGRVLELSCSQ